MEPAALAVKLYRLVTHQYLAVNDIGQSGRGFPLQLQAIGNPVAPAFVENLFGIVPMPPRTPPDPP